MFAVRLPEKFCGVYDRILPYTANVRRMFAVRLPEKFCGVYDRILPYTANVRRTFARKIVRRFCLRDKTPSYVSRDGKMLLVERDSDKLKFYKRPVC